MALRTCFTRLTSNLSRRAGDARTGCLVALLAALPALGCSDDSEKAAEGDAGKNPAVLVTAQSVTPDDYLTYVAAFDDVPQGHVDLAGFREFGNSNVYAYGGYAFVENDGVVKRFSVGQDLTLIDGPELSWQNFGIARSNASYAVFVSKHRAYTLAPDLGVVVVWDPESMEVTGTLPVDLPRPPDMETWAYDGYLVGDKVFWNVFSGDFENFDIYPAVTVVIADAESDAPVRIIEDPRCLPGGGSRVDEKGDYYVEGGAYYGFFLTYAPVAEGAKTCMLRIKAGETEFDADYAVDYEELLGSYVSDPWYHVKGRQYVVRSWDPEVPFPEDSEEFYDNEALRPLFVDLDEGSVEPYPDLAGKTGIDGVTRKVDGAAYYQLSETGYVPGGTAEIVELKADGIHPRFDIDGFLLGLERLR